MPNETLPDEVDSLLLPFLSAETDSESQAALNRLFEQTIIPQIRKVLSSYLTLLESEKDEISSDAQTKILTKLQKMRENFKLGVSPAHPIRNLSAYITRVVINARIDFILRKQPEWRRTENRLSRLKEETECDWHFFTDAEDNKLVGLKSKSITRNQIEFEEIVSLIRTRYPNHLFLKIQELTPIILESADGALTKNELIRAILEITESTRFEEIEIPEDLSEYLNHSDEYRLAKRQNSDLHRIWDEIRKFPANQRKVLLLSLKESRKIEAISLLLKKRIATIKEIAEALEISLEEFSGIFAILPMSSSEIADFLGIKDKGKTTKEQRVDNLRRIARDLLRRRLGIKND